MTHNITVPVNATTCTAPGYSFISSPVLSETFDDYSGDGGTTPPPGWTIQDNEGNGQVWDFNNPEGRGNLTGGSGFFAAANSDQFGPGATQNTSLITPTVSLAGESNPMLQFNNDYFGFPGQTAAVDVSTDGGTTWTNVREHTSDSVRGPDLEVVPLTAFAGDTSVQVRFHFTSSFGWWWEVDNVTIGNRACSPVSGGLVVGQVTDANTGTGLSGATVTDTNNTSATTTTGPSGDPALATGYYWMFDSDLGSHSFTAARGGYQTAAQAITVTSGTSTDANFALGAGQLTITPSSITTSQVLGTATNTTMTLKNTGTAPVNVKLVQQGGTFQLLTAKGSPLKLVPLGDDQDTGATPAFLGGHANDGAPLVNAGPPADQPTWSTITSYPTGVMDNSADFINGNAYSVGGLNTSFSLLNNGYVYDPVQNTWSAIANMPVAREKPGVVADNGKLYVSGGWNAAGTPIAETDVYDPTSNTWTTVSPNPNPATAPGVASANGLVHFVAGCEDSACTAGTNVEVYNPATDTWSTAAPYPQGDSWLSCGGINGKVYCSGGTNGTSTFSNGYVYDPGTNAWSPIANMPIDLWASASGAADGMLVVSTGVTNGFSTVTNQGYAYDPVQNTWSALPNAQFSIYRSSGSCGFYQIGGSSGGFSPQSSSEMLSGLTECGTTNIPWMTETPATATVQPGQSVPVTVTLTATQADTVTQPGTYTAQIGFEQDTPYDVSPVDVTMNVTPPTGWGEIVGTLSGENCSQTTAPLRGVIFANGKGKKGFQFTLPTGTDGTYAFWGPANGNPWQLTASAAGWIAVNSANINLKGGKTITVNFTLRPVTC